MVRKQEGRSHTALRGMSGSTHTVLRWSIHPETHTQIHTDHFNIPLNNCRNHCLNCLQMIYCSSWTTVQLSPSFLCSLFLIVSSVQNKAWNPAQHQGYFSNMMIRTQKALLCLPLMRSVCSSGHWQLMFPLLAVHYLCRILRALLSPSFPLALSRSLTHSLRLSCSPFIFYLSLLFSRLLTVRLLCVVHCLRYNSAGFWEHLDAFLHWCTFWIHDDCKVTK